MRAVGVRPTWRSDLVYSLQPASPRRVRRDAHDQPQSELLPIAYRRVLLKVSGEVLMGDAPFGIEHARRRRGGRGHRAVVGVGVRALPGHRRRQHLPGRLHGGRGMERASADYMGMLGTVMNALAMQNALEKIGREDPCPVGHSDGHHLRALHPPPGVRHLEKGRVVIFAAGTGNPFFTTDTAAALRAAEMGCDVLIKGTSVDGVYTADPKKDPDAERYDS